MPGGEEWILTMMVSSLSLTKEDVLECARMMGILEQAQVITDDVLAQVRKGLEWGLECWSEAVMSAIDFALKS